MPWVGSKLLDLGDIQNLRMMTDEIHRHGGLAGVKLTHGSSVCFNAETRMPNSFLYPWNNKRTDDFGGSFENRARFTVELRQMLRDEIKDCAIGIRFPIDTLDRPFGYGDQGVRAEDKGVTFNALLGDLVDYCDINIGTLNWGEDAGSSRFFETNHEAPIPATPGGCRRNPSSTSAALPTPM